MIKHGGYDSMGDRSADTVMPSARLEDDQTARGSEPMDMVRSAWRQAGPHHHRQLPGERETASAFWSSLATEEMSRHGIRAISKTIAAKSVLFFKGDPATYLYIVVSGRVKVSAPSDDGKEITFAILGPGELVGEMGVFEETDHTATVTAMEPTELAVVNRHDFLCLVGQSPALALKLVAVLGDRLRRANEMAEDISFLALPVRLAKKLLALAHAFGHATPDGTRIGLQLCQQELANMVGTSRESINKQLSTWHAEGLVTQDRGYVTIHQIDRFEVWAASVWNPAHRVGRCV